MNKKAFTLVELLVVIIIMGILATIFIPVAFNMINTTEEKAFVTSSKSMINAAEKYYTEERPKLVFNGSYYLKIVSVEELKESGYLDKIGDFDKSVVVIKKLVNNSEVNFLIFASDGKYLIDGSLYEQIEVDVTEGSKIYYSDMPQAYFEAEISG